MQQPPNPYPHYPEQQWQQPSQPLPPQQQWNPQQPYPQQPPKEPKRTWYRRLLFWCRRHPIITAVIIVVFLVTGIISIPNVPQTSTSTPTEQATQAAQDTTAIAQPIQTPTSQSIHYPPTMVADLHGLAAEGDVSAIHEFHSESVGLTGVCPQPKREVTVDPSVTGQQLAEDLLAYFYAQQLDSPCGSLVLAYHNQGEANDAYTAGRINFDATDLSGAGNVDPNATNLKYTLTLDIGGSDTGQEYTVTY